MIYAGFDIETNAGILNDDGEEPKIYCAGISATPGRPVKFWYARDDGGQPLARHMTSVECGIIVDDLLRYVEQGMTLVAVNGLAFDLWVLGQASGRVDECRWLAHNFMVDPLYMAVCKFGWRVGVNALAAGAGLRQKVAQVTLKTGEVFEGMSGLEVEQLWLAGEFDACLIYLGYDCEVTRDIAHVAAQKGELYWRSKTGKPYAIAFPKGRLPLVKECYGWPRPDQGWMSEPPDIDGMYNWSNTR